MKTYDDLSHDDQVLVDEAAKETEHDLRVAVVSGDKRLVYDATCSEMVKRLDAMLWNASQVGVVNAGQMAGEGHDLLHEIAERLLDNEFAAHGLRV